MTPLTDSNFMIYAAKNYTNSHCYDTEEFQDDLKKFKYLKRLFSRYHDRKELKVRLILNHMITIYNVFDAPAATRMMFFRTEHRHYYILKSFLTFLNYMPDVVYNLGEEDVNLNAKDIPIDINITRVLREL